MAGQGFIRRSLGLEDNSAPDNQMWNELAAEQAGMANVYAAAGFANLMATPAAQQGVMQAGLKNASDVTNALRNRYFQTEWEQIQKTKIDPILQSINEAQSRLRSNLSMATRPTPRMVGPVEGQQIADTVQGEEPGVDTIDQGKTVDGRPKAPKEVTVPAPPAPNPSLMPGQIGATSMEDNLTLMDPVTGNPVRVDSPRGITIMQQHVYDFMDMFEKANTQILDIISSYPGNPYAQQAGHNIIDNVIKQAGTAVTGQFNPEAQLEWWQKRQAFDAQIEAQKTQNNQGVFNLQSAQGGRSAGVRRAEALAADPQYAHYFASKGLGEKLINQAPLSPAEEAEAAGTAAMLDKLAAQQVVKDARSGRVVLPDYVQAHPGDWENFVKTKDPEYRTLLAEQQNSVVNKKQAELAALNSTTEGKQKLAKLLEDAGATPQAVDFALRGMWDQPDVKSFIKTMIAKNNPELFQEAADGAYILRLRALENRQPELTPVIDQSNEEYIQALHDEMHRRGLPDFGPEEEAVIRADRYRTFFSAHSQRKPPNIYDPLTKTAVDQAEEARHRAGMTDYEADKIKGYVDDAREAAGLPRLPSLTQGAAGEPNAPGDEAEAVDNPQEESDEREAKYYAEHPEVAARLDALRERGASILGPQEPVERPRVSHEEVNAHGDEQAAAEQEQKQGALGPLRRREPFQAAPSEYDLLSVDPQNLTPDQVSRGSAQLRDLGERLAQQNTPPEVWQQYHEALKRFDAVRWGDIGDTANRLLTTALDSQTQTLQAEQEGNKQIVDFVLKTIGEANARNEQRKLAEIEALRRGK